MLTKIGLDKAIIKIMFAVSAIFIKSSASSRRNPSVGRWQNWRTVQPRNIRTQNVPIRVTVHFFFVQNFGNCFPKVKLSIGFFFATTSEAY